MSESGLTVCGAKRSRTVQFIDYSASITQTLSVSVDVISFRRWKCPSPGHLPGMSSQVSQIKFQEAVDLDQDPVPSVGAHHQRCFGPVLAPGLNLNRVLRSR